MAHEINRKLDERFEKLMGLWLRIGVITAALWVLAGGIHYLVIHHGAAPDYRVFHGEPNEFTEYRAILEAALHLSSRGLIQMGLLLLIATPVARVAFCVIGFAVEHDWLYVGVALLVLTILVLSLSGIV